MQRLATDLVAILKTSVAHAAAITAFVDATAGMILLITPDREQLRGVHNNLETTHMPTLSESVRDAFDVELVCSCERFLTNPLYVPRVVAVNTDSI